MGAPGIATRSKDVASLLGAKDATMGAPGIATRSKGRYYGGSWHRY